MKNENELKPIQYVIENINGTQKITHTRCLEDGTYKPHDNNPIEFKNYTSLIRIQSDEGTSVDEIVKIFSLNGIEKNLKTYISVYNSPLNIKDVPIDAFVENTNDLFFELIENFKIIITIFHKSKNISRRLLRYNLKNES